jgi:hypothetical protein
MDRRFDDEKDAPVLDDRRDVPMTDNNDSQVPHQRENLLANRPDDDRLDDERPADSIVHPRPGQEAEAFPAASAPPHAGPGPVYGGRDELDDESTDVSPDPAHDLPVDTPGEVRHEVESGSPAHAADGEDLFGQDVEDVQRRWHDVQAAFVDDPRVAVERADELLGEVVGAVTSTLNSRTEKLQDGWKSGDETDTEQLRLALRGYRSVLDQLTRLSGEGSPSIQGTR